MHATLCHKLRVGLAQRREQIMCTLTEFVSFSSLMVIVLLLIYGLPIIAG